MALAQILIRRGTSAEWATANPVLAAGEFGYDSTAKRAKVGDGQNAWTGLSWVTMSSSDVTRLEAAAAALQGATAPTDAAMTTIQANPNSAFAQAQKATFAPVRATARGRIQAALATRRTTPVIIGGAGSSTMAGVGASSPDRRWLNLHSATLQRGYPMDSGATRPVMTLAEAVASPPTAPGIYVVNAGVAGTTADNYLTSTTGPQLAGLNPHIIIHVVGSNDFRNDVPIATFEANIRARLATLDAGSAREIIHVFVLQFQRSDAPVMDGTLHPWRAYGDVFAKIAAEKPSARLYVNLDPDYRAAGVPGADPYGLMTSDLIHQGDAGHSMMEDLFSEFIGVRPSAGGASSSRVVILNPAQPITGPVSVVDTFDRADGPIGTADTGQVWQVLQGSPVVSGGKLNPGAGSSLMLIDNVGTDVSVQSKMVRPVSGSSTGIAVRAAGTNYRLAWYWLPTDSSLSLAKVENGALISFATIPFATHGIALGVEHTLRVDVKSDQLKGFVNGVERASRTLTSAEVATFTGTGVGIRASSGGALMDDFVGQPLA